MAEGDRRAAWLGFHGSIVLFVGLLAGAGFAAAVLGEWPAATVANWRLAHVQSCVNGMLLIGLAAAYRLLLLSPGLATCLVWIVVVSVYADTAGLAIRAISGETGMELRGPLTNWLAFAGFSANSIGVLVAVPILAWGFWARATLRRTDSTESVRT